MKYLLSILLSSIIGMNLYASDTLSVYDASSVNDLYYNAASYSQQIARFDLPQPATLNSLIIQVDGPVNASFDLSLLGHEGGVMLPDLFNSVYGPTTLVKQKDGVENIVFTFDKPVYLANNQFFILFNNIDPTIKILSDRKNHDIYCQSNNGGLFYYQYLYKKSDQQWYLPPNSTNRAFAIDVILDYEIGEEKILRDATNDAKIAFNLSNRSIAAADYNNDGSPDLLISGQLYENQNDGTFKDLSSTLGIRNPYSGISANAWIDIDNDNDLDIVLFGSDTSVVLINDLGSFTLQILNLPTFNALSSFSFADINFDGYPDLFIGQLWKTYPEAEPNRLFLNDKNLGFTDATKMLYPKWDGTWNYPDKGWYVNHTTQQYLIEKNRNSRGSEWVDFDNDGDPDLYVTNYFLQKDEFYRNNGDGSFTDVATDKKIDVTFEGTAQEGANHGTGVDWFDYDNDGDFDLLLPQFAHPRFIKDYDHRGTTIYRNEGAPAFNFTDLVGQYNDYKGLKSDIGLELEETHAGGAWGDVNNDGLADFILTVFYGCRYIDIYEQQPDHSFKLKTYAYGLEGINTGNDLIWLDYNADGRLDVALADQGKFRLFIHDKWTNKAFVGIKLSCESGNRYAIGARVEVYANGNKYLQQVSAGRGQKMQNPYTLHFGLNKATLIDSVVVYWPVQPQKREVFKQLDVNKFYILKENGGATVSRLSASASELKIYPNPANTSLNIDFGSLAGKQVRLNLVDVNGKVVYSQQLSSGTTLKTFILNLNKNITTETYILTLSGEEFTLKRKILIKQ